MTSCTARPGGRERGRHPHRRLHGEGEGGGGGEVGGEGGDGGGGAELTDVAANSAGRGVHVNEGGVAFATLSALCRV